MTLDVHRAKVLVSKLQHVRNNPALPAAAHAVARYLADTMAPARAPPGARPRLKE